MRAQLSILAFATLVVSTVQPASAQDEGDYAAWLALMATPYGAIAPAMTPGMLGTAPTGRVVEFRVAQFEFDGADEAVRAFGLGGRVGRFGLVAGYQTCDGCDGTFMAGADYDGTLVTRSMGMTGSPAMFVVGLRPAIGFGRISNDIEDVTALSGAVDLPLSMAFGMGPTAKLVPHITPGFGFGRLSGGDESESGTRASIGAGVGLKFAGTLGVNLGWRKVLLEDAPGTWGLGMSIGR